MADLDSRILTGVAGVGSEFNPFFASILEAWVRKYNFVQRIAAHKPVFAVGDQNVIPGAIFEGEDVIAEIKTRIADEGPNTTDLEHAKRYKAIIDKKLKAVDGADEGRTFKRVIYVLPRSGIEPGKLVRLWQDALLDVFKDDSMFEIQVASAKR